MRNLYIVLTHTGTLPSRLIRAATGAHYTHASLALDSGLARMFSFARRHVDLPLVAGFVAERPGEGVFALFPDTTCAVYRLPVSNACFAAVERIIADFYREYDNYRYNFLGLPLIRLGIPLRRAHHFVCSQFVADVLERAQAVRFPRETALITPSDLAALPGAQLAYRGRLADYRDSCRLRRRLGVAPTV